MQDDLQCKVFEGETRASELEPYALWPSLVLSEDMPPLDKVTTGLTPSKGVNCLLGAT